MAFVVMVPSVCDASACSQAEMQSFSCSDAALLVVLIYEGILLRYQQSSGLLLPVPDQTGLQAAVLQERSPKI